MSAATSNTKTKKTEDDPLLPSTRNGGDMHPTSSSDDGTLKFKVQPETIRFYAYLFFWAMAIIAILITRLVTKDRLLQGPPSSSQTGEPLSCPPFQNGVGFDIDTDSHLMKAFGFNNASIT